MGWQNRMTYRRTYPHTRGLLSNCRLERVRFYTFLDELLVSGWLRNMNVQIHAARKICF